MSDFYAESRAFVHQLRESQSPSSIATVCKLPLQVVYAILADASFDMGTIYHRKILSAKLNWIKLQRLEHWKEVDAKMPLADYKENRSMEPPRLKEGMKGL